LIFSEEYGHYFSISFDLLVHIIIFVFHPNGSPKKENKIFPMKRKYITEQDGNSDEKGTSERANKNLPKHDLSNGKDKT